MRNLIKIFPLAALVCALLSVPALAADDCVHDWGNSDGICTLCGEACAHDSTFTCYDGYGEHTCDICNASGFICSDADGDFHCDVCGMRSLVLVNGGCSHLATSASSDCVCVYVDDSDDHIAYCAECRLSYPALDLVYNGLGFESSLITDEHRLSLKHTASDCSGCSSFEQWFVVFPFDVPASGVLDCTHHNGPDIQTVKFWPVYYDEKDHYFVCPDCSAWVPFWAFNYEAIPHVDPCTYCTDVIAGGFTVVGPLSSLSSPSIIDTTTSVFSGVLEMASITADTVLDSALLLVAVLLPCVGFSVLLFRRIRR